MLYAVEITLKNKSAIAAVNNGLVPYDDDTIRSLKAKTYFIMDDESDARYVVPLSSFERRYRFIDPPTSNPFNPVIKK